MKKIPVGISSCLMGNKVRYDGGHKKCRYCTEVLKDIFEYTVVCPEKEAGLGIPRPTIRLESSDNSLIAVEPKSRNEYTDEIKRVFSKRQQGIGDLCGFIFTKNSPSCGLFRVKVYNEKGAVISTDGRGVFSEQLTKKYPLMPVEEAERLNDARLRENFVLRVTAYHQWKNDIAPSLSKHKLLRFYSEYKLVMLSHSPEHYKKIGVLLSNLKVKEVGAIANEFIALFMDGIKRPASRENHANTLMHIQGYFKRKFIAQEKQELASLIMSYKKGEVPLVAPITLLKHHLSKHPEPYLLQQRYITPYPEHLGLRSSI